MSEGKNEVWKIVDPLRTDSMFHQPALTTPEHNGEDFLQLPTCSRGTVELKTLPAEYVKLYGLDVRSNTENNDSNPYHTAATIMARLLDMECNQSTILTFLSFINHMHPTCKQLLQLKDPYALLLLAYWYAKMSQYRQWWIQRRAVLEGQAICIYLERYHRDEESIQNLMLFPRMVYGLVAC